MDDLSVPKQPRLRFWRWLYHPLVLISVAVHGLLLAAPVPSALDPEKPAVEEPLPEPEEEIIPVDILNLAPPPAAPPPSATPAQAPQPSSGPPVPPSAEELEKLQETLTDEERQDLQNDPPPGNNDPDPGQNQGGGPPLPLILTPLGRDVSLAVLISRTMATLIKQKTGVHCTQDS
ncbi:MAG: hypothetical protein HC886_03185 [Leptolyngbyaceae cyanobacterium SM1_1_3]|nr:hypothetical protein [Leptolyngbyaceae cyanobacterium SM1_1_3]